MRKYTVRRLKTFEEIHPSWHHVIKDEHKKFLGKRVHIQMTTKARVVLKDIKDVLSVTESLEKKLVGHINDEKALLKKEKETV